MTQKNWRPWSRRRIRRAAAVFASSLACTGMGADLVRAQTAPFLPPAANSSGLGPSPGQSGDADALSPLVRGGWLIQSDGQLGLTYTDNAYLTRDNRQSDFVFQPAAAMRAQETSAHTIFDGHLGVAYDAYTQATDLSGARIDALADGTAHSADETFSLRGRLATDLQPSSYLGAVPATPRVIGSNQVQILSYGAEPTFRRSFSDDLTAEAHYAFSGVTFIDGPNGSAPVGASDSFRHDAEARLSNSTAAVPLTWNIVGTYEEQDLSGSAPASQRAGGEANGQYAINTLFALVGRGGYEWLREPTLNDKLSGPYALAGFIYRPTNRSSLHIEAGYRYGRANYLGELKYNPSEAINLTASYNQGVDTSQGFLSNLFNRSGRDAEGNYVDPTTGLAPDARLLLFDFTNQAFRYARTRLGVQGDLGRTFYTASAAYERRSAAGIWGESWSGEASIGRHLTRNLTATLDGNYTRTTHPTFAIATATATETESASASLNYLLNPTTTASLRYVYLKQNTTLLNYRENAAVITLAKSF